MRTRTRIHPYVLPEIACRLASYCGAQGITESAAVEAAIEQYLDSGEKDHEVMLRRLDRLGRASGRQHRALEVLSEAFGIFLHRWLATLPELTDTERDAVTRLSEKRYRTFLDTLARNLAGARRLATDDVSGTSNGAGRSEPAVTGPR